MSVSSSDSDSKTRVHEDPLAGFDRDTTSPTMKPSPTALIPWPPSVKPLPHESILDRNDPIDLKYNERTSDGKRIELKPSPVSLIVAHRHKKKHIDNHALVVNEYQDIYPRNRVGDASNVPPVITSVGLGWTRHTHPEGKVYFRYKNVYTDAWLYEDNTRHNVEAAVARLRRRLIQEHQNKPLPDNIEIGIHLMEQDGDKAGTKRWFHNSGVDPVVQGCYYICDVTGKQVFWLDKVHADVFWEDIDHQIVGNDHLRLAAEAAYWEHLYLFPHDRTISQDELDDLREELAFWTFDAGSSVVSISPYTATELEGFAKIVGKFKANSNRAEHACIVGKLKGALLKIRFAYFYGEKHAQINNSRGVFPHHNDPDHHSFWFRLLNSLSFYTAASYYVNLNHLWIGRTMSTSRWNDFVVQLQDDWLAAITPATVVLAANLSFLALSSVDQNGPHETERNLGQIVSYISLILNISNIAASTILARQHRSGDHSGFEGEPPKGGPHEKQLQELERLAVVFSIPATFFWWGLLTFFISIGWICLNRTAQPTRYTVVVTIVLSMLLLLLVIVYTYRDNHRRSFAGGLRALLPLPTSITRNVPRNGSSSQDLQEQPNNSRTQKLEA